MLYVYFGPDEHSKRTALKALASRTNLPMVEFSATNAPKSLDELLSQDLFSGSQVIVLHNLIKDWLTDARLEQYVTTQNHIVFVEDALDKRTKFYKDLTANKNVHAKEFEAPSLESLPQWIKNFVAAKHVSIEESAIDLLLLRLGATNQIGNGFGASPEVSLLQLEQELTKLLTYANGLPIDKSAVEALVGDLRETLSLAVSDALAKKDRARLFELLESYYASGDADDTAKTLQLNALLAEQLRSLLIVKDATERRMQDSDILALTGWKSGRLFVVKRLSQGLSIQALREMLSKIESLDIELKSSTTPPRVILELILAQVV